MKIYMNTSAKTLNDKIFYLEALKKKKFFFLIFDKINIKIDEILLLLTVNIDQNISLSLIFNIRKENKIIINLYCI